MATHPSTYMLTTVDNPYDPFTQWDEWYAYDEGKGYYTSGMLARITITSQDLSDTDQDLAISSAIDEIVRENVLGLYKKAYPISKSDSENKNRGD